MRVNFGHIGTAAIAMTIFIFLFSGFRPSVADRLTDLRTAYDSASSAYFSGLSDPEANVAALKRAKDEAFAAYQAESRSNGIETGGILGDLDVLPGADTAPADSQGTKSTFRESLDRQYEAVRSRIQNFLTGFGTPSRTGTGDDAALSVGKALSEKGLDDFLAQETSTVRLLEAAEILKGKKDYIALARACARLAEVAPKNSEAAAKASEYLAYAEASMLLEATEPGPPDFSSMSTDELAARAAEVRGKIDAKNMELSETGFFNFFKKARLNSELVTLQTEYTNLRTAMAGGPDGAKIVTSSRTSRAPGRKYAVCVKSSYNVRSGPWGDKVGEISKGDRVEILGQAKDDKGKVWYKVSAGGKTGFCYFEGLRMEEGGGGTTQPGPSAPGLSDEFQSSIVKALFRILYETGEIPTELSKSRLCAFFADNRTLSACFPDLVASGDYKGMSSVVTGLSRMLHYTPLRKALNSKLAAGDYAGAYAEYVDKYQDNYDDPAIYDFNEKAVPTIVINIPSRQLRVYRDGLLVHDFPTVPGKPNPAGSKENTQTRVGGKFKITEWCKDYTTASYPDKWSENKWKGAFGKYAAKIGPNGNGQHIHGTTGPEWIGNLPINYAPGSHGCSRLANKNVTILHDFAPIGTKVVKTYCVREIQAAKGVFGESFKRKTHENIYHYEVSNGGWFIPGAGVLIDHSEPSDAIK